MKPRLVALDIDGTLIRPGATHHELPGPSMAHAVRELADAGVVVVLASGRMFPGTHRVARHFGLDTPRICQQGAAVYHGDGRLEHHCAIEHDIAIDLIAYARVHSWPFAWFDAARYIASGRNPASQAYADVSGIEAEYHPAPETIGVAPTGIDIISNLASAPRVHRELDGRYGERVHLLDFPGVTAAHSPEASKGNAIARLARELDIPREQVVAIGDSVNDVSMLRWAGYGATPAHGDRYALEAADEVLPGEGVDGVEALLRHLAAQARR